MVRKIQEYHDAIKMRTEGKSIKSIARILRVSSSTVARWVKDVELTDQQLKILEKNQHKRIFTHEDRVRAGQKGGARNREKALLNWRENGKYTTCLKPIILAEQNGVCSVCKYKSIWNGRYKRRLRYLHNKSY